MRRLVFLPAVALFAASACAQVTLVAENTIKKGWMPGGWGSYRFVLKNAGTIPATFVKWSGHWEADGKKLGDPWGGDVNETIQPGKDLVHGEAGYLGEDVVKAAAPNAPKMVGTVTLKQGDKTIELNYSFDVPGAKLPEPTKLVKGKTAGMELMQSRYKDFKHIDRTLQWVDQCYSAMIDLTGQKPFGGKLMVFKESPAHPWWAYAGQEMILNTDYVGETLKDFDDGIMSFGWIHEVGHNFDDGIGDWYNWSGPACEFQANFKLCYAFETIADQSFRIRWTFQAPGFPSPDKTIRLTGHDLVERFFLCFGDSYLADPKRTWDTLSSDEMHTLFQRIQRCYGWDVYKNWYRTYRHLTDAGKKPPSTAEEKVRLICAILSKEAKVDLVPLFQRWRFPVTKENVKELADRYGI